MDFDWTKHMVIDWSGRNGPVIKEEDIKNSVIKRIIRNQYTAPFCDREFTRVNPSWSPHDPFGTNFENNPTRSNNNFIPGLHPVPPYPQLSTLTKAQHQQALRVLSAKYHSVQPRDYVLPTEKSYQVFQEIQELYEIEQKEYQKWAKQLWINGDCIRALRPKPVIEKVYEAEFKMKTSEIRSLPKNYTLAAQIPLQRKNQTFEFEHKTDLINVDIRDLPIVDCPDVMENNFSVLEPCPIPEPCKEHPCKFVLPNENSVSVLPHSEIQHEIAQYAIENGVSFAASENALRCLLETECSWMIPVAVVEAIGPDGDMRNVIVLGSEFGVQKECATQRTYKAYKHLLQHTFAPSTGHYQIKTPTTKQTNQTSTSVPIEKHVAPKYNHFDSFDTDVAVSSDDDDKLRIDDLEKCQPNLPGLDNELTSKQGVLAIDYFTKEPYEPGINEFDFEPMNLGDKSDGETNSERDSDEGSTEPNRLMIDDSETNPELSYSNDKPSYYEDSYEPDFFIAKERPNYGLNEPSSESGQVMIDDASDLEPSYSNQLKESSYSVDTSDRPETNKQWMNEPKYSKNSRESSYSIDTVKTSYIKDTGQTNYSVIKEPNYTNEPSVSIDKVSNYSANSMARSCSKTETCNLVKRSRYSNDISDSSDSETNTANTGLRLYDTNKDVDLLEINEHATLSLLEANDNATLRVSPSLETSDKNKDTTLNLSQIYIDANLSVFEVKKDAGLCLSHTTEEPTLNMCQKNKDATLSLFQTEEIAIPRLSEKDKDATLSLSETNKDCTPSSIEIDKCASSLELSKTNKDTSLNLLETNEDTISVSSSLETNDINKHATLDSRQMNKDCSSLFEVKNALTCGKADSSHPLINKLHYNNGTSHSSDSDTDTANTGMKLYDTNKHLNIMLETNEDASLACLSETDKDTTHSLFEANKDTTASSSETNRDATLSLTETNKENMSRWTETGEIAIPSLSKKTKDATLRLLDITKDDTANLVAFNKEVTLQPKESETMATKPILSSNELTTTELKVCVISSRKISQVTARSPVEQLNIDSCLRKKNICVTNTAVKVYKSKSGQQKVNAMKPCIKKQSPHHSPQKNTGISSFFDSVVSKFSTPETEDSSQSKDSDKNRSTNLLSEDISNERAKRLSEDIYREYHYFRLDNSAINEFPSARGISGQKSDNGPLASSDVDNSSPEKLIIDIASKPNDSQKEPGVRMLSLHKTVPAKTEKSSINNTAYRHPEKLETNKPISNLQKPKAGKIKVRELFGDESDSDESTCTNTNRYIDITAKGNYVRASSESPKSSTSPETKPMIINILNSDEGTAPLTDPNYRKLIEKSPLEPCLRKSSLSEPSPGKCKRKLSFSDPLTSDPEFRVSHSESESKEYLAGFDNDGFAVSTNETKEKQNEPLTHTYGLRTRTKQIAKTAAKKCKTKLIKNRTGFTKTVPTTNNKQNKNTEQVTPRKSRRISALLHSDSSDDSNYLESSRRTSNRIKNNKQMAPGVRRSRSLSSRVCSEDSDETKSKKTNMYAKDLTENTDGLRRSPRISVLNAKVNVQSISNKKNTSVHKSNETNTETYKNTVNSNSLSKVIKKYRRKSLPTNIFSKHQKNNLVLRRSNSLKNWNDIAIINKSLQSNSRSSSSKSLHAIEKDNICEISERTKRYFHRSLNSLYSETDQTEGEMSQRTKRYIRRSISSACSETEQAYSDLRKRTKKYTHRSNITSSYAKKTNNSKTAVVSNVESIEDGQFTERTKRYMSRSMNLVYLSCDESEQPKIIRRKKTRRPLENNDSNMGHIATNEMDSSSAMETNVIDQPTTIRLKSEVMDTENQTGSVNPIKPGLSMDANDNGTETCEIKIDFLEETLDEIKMLETKRQAKRNQMDISEDNLNTEAQSLNLQKSKDEKYNIFHFRVSDTERSDLESSDTDNTLCINQQATDVTKQMETDDIKVLYSPESNSPEIDITEVNVSNKSFDYHSTFKDNNGTNEAKHAESQIEYKNEDQELIQIEPKTDITNLPERNKMIIRSRKLSISEASDNSDYYFENNDTELNLYHFTARNETDSEDESEQKNPTFENPQLADNSQPCSLKQSQTVIYQTAERSGDKTQKNEVDQPGPTRTQNHFFNYQSNITETKKIESTVPQTAEIESNNRGGKKSLFSIGSSNHEQLDASELSREAIGVNNCVCKGTLFEIPPPRSFKKWQVRNTTTNTSFNLIVHSSHKARKGSKEVLLEPIVEYQPELGGAKQSPGKIRSIALSLMIRKEAELMNARIDHENGNVIVIENVNEAEFTSRHGDQRNNIGDTLYTAIEQLRSLMPGQYVLAHDASHGANAMLYSAKGAREARGARALSLHQDNINMPDAEDALHAKIPPELDGVLLPYHKYRSTLPLAFTPYPKQVREDRRGALARARHPPHAIQWPKKKKFKKSRHDR